MATTTTNTYKSYSHTTFALSAGKTLEGLVYVSKLNMNIPSTMYWDVTSSTNASSGTSKTTLDLTLGFQGGTISTQGLIVLSKTHKDLVDLLQTSDTLSIHGNDYHGTFSVINAGVYNNYLCVYEGSLLFNVKFIVPTPPKTV